MANNIDKKEEYYSESFHFGFFIICHIYIHFQNHDL